MRWWQSPRVACVIAWLFWSVAGPALIATIMWGFGETVDTRSEENR